MKIPVTPKYIARKGEFIYILCNEINLLYRISTKSNKIDVMKTVPEESYLKENLYSAVSIEDQKMILVPQNAQKLWMYDFGAEKWEAVDISKFISSNMHDKFMGGILKNDKAYLFGYQYKGILVVNTKTKEIKPLFDKIEYNDTFWGKNFALVGDNIYIPFRTRKEIVCIDTVKDSYEVLPIYGDNIRADIANDGIAYDGYNFFILLNKGNVLLEWNKKRRAEEVPFDELYNNNVTYFDGIEYIGNSLLLLYGPGSLNYVYDQKNPNDSIFIREPIMYAKSYSDFGIVICQKGVIKHYSHNMDLINEYVIEMDAPILEAYFRNAKLDSSGYQENNIWGLKELLRLLIK